MSKRRIPALALCETARDNADMTAYARCLAVALLLALAGTSAAAKSFACEPWSVAGYQEHGPITIRISDSELTWSNGTVVRAAARLAADIFADSHEVIMVSGAQFPTVRRVPRAPQAPLSATRCTPAP